MKASSSDAVAPGNYRRPQIRKSRDLTFSSISCGTPLPSLEARRTVLEDQKGFSFGISLILSAEALHKERIALESVLEPWLCTLKIRYVRLHT